LYPRKIFLKQMKNICSSCFNQFFLTSLLLDSDREFILKKLNITVPGSDIEAYKNKILNNQ
jgi:hypothetical protein